MHDTDYNQINIGSWDLEAFICRSFFHMCVFVLVTMPSWTHYNVSRIYQYAVVIICNVFYYKQVFNEWTEQYNTEYSRNKMLFAAEQIRNGRKHSVHIVTYFG